MESFTRMLHFYCWGQELGSWALGGNEVPNGNGKKVQRSAHCTEAINNNMRDSNNMATVQHEVCAVWTSTITIERARSLVSSFCPSNNVISDGQCARGGYKLAITGFGTARRATRPYQVQYLPEQRRGSPHQGQIWPPPPSPRCPSSRPSPLTMATGCPSKGLCDRHQHDHASNRAHPKRLEIAGLAP
jgi:hypothetical protein